MNGLVGPPAAPGPAAQEQAFVALPGDAIVIRGGLMADLDAMLKSIEEEHVISGRYGLSVGCRPSLTANEIAEVRGTNRLPHPKMRAGTVGRLRNVDWEVILDENDEGPAHALAIKNQMPTLAELDAAVQTFGEAQPNPVRRT
jgi:hypothetical protein